MNKYFFIILFSLIFLSSCSKQEYTWKTMESNDLYKFLAITNQVFPEYGPQVTQGSYAIPEKRWIENVYFPALYIFLRDNEVLTWKDPQNNCAKFSIYGVAAGNKLFYKKRYGPKNTSLAIGLADYYLEKQNFKGHSANCFVAHENNKLVLVYTEPQQRKFINSEEIEDMWVGIRF